MVMDGQTDGWRDRQKGEKMRYREIDRHFMDEQTVRWTNL